MTDLEVTSKLSDEKFSELLEICFKFLTGEQQASHCLDVLKKFSESVNVELPSLEPVVKAIMKLCKDAVKVNKSVSQLQVELRNLGFSEEHVEIFSKKWEKDYNRLIHATSASTFEVNPLIDMEWKFGVTSASSELNTVGNVFLHLKLDVDKGNSKRESICFELQLPEFYAFLHEMERAKASLEYLS